MPTLTSPSQRSVVRPHRWTREEYEHMVEVGAFRPDARLELIEGEIIEMSPQGSRHATTVRRFEEALRSTFREGFDVRSQLPLALSASSEPEPDVCVVLGHFDDYLDAHPTEAVLLVEVSDATLALDRTVKLAVYAAAGVPEYWIANLPDACLEVYRDPAGDTYRTKTTLRHGDTVAPEAQPKHPIPVADLIP
jgi:Uma2 family endonuclease